MSNPQLASRPEVSTHLQQPQISGFLLTFFETVFLPILPGLLSLLAPKIASNPRLLAVLKEVDVVIDGLIRE